MILKVILKKYEGGQNMNRTTDFTGREIEFDCMSCDIANHKLVSPGGMIYEDEFVTLAGDVEVPIEGFIILAPKKHVTSLVELTALERFHLMETLNESIKALKKLGICESVQIFQEEKHHLHIWILPVHPWMKSWLCGVKSSNKLLQIARYRAQKTGVYTVLYTIQRLKTYFKDYQ